MRPILLSLAILASTAHGATIYKTNAIHVSNADLNCLAANIYHESRGEDYVGQLGVAQITYNRAKNSSICKVVHKRGQFSWTANRHKRKSPPPGEEWADSLETAKSFIKGNRIKGLEGITFFKAAHVRVQKVVMKIGNIKFHM